MVVVAAVDAVSCFSCCSLCLSYDVNTISTVYEINQQVDISGECQVTYHRLNEAHLSKVKTACRSLYTAGRFKQVNPVIIAPSRFL